MCREKYDIVAAAEIGCKELYNFGLFGLNAFYKVSNLESLKQSFDAYSLSRFSQAIEAFQYEHEKIDREKRKEFYEDLKYNEQNLAYLYSMFEKARTSTFLIHMKILARLSSLLIENKKLNYWQSSLLANINSLTEDDFKYLYNLQKNKITSPLYTNDSCQVSAINKFIQSGILSVNESSKTVIGSPDDFNFTINFMLNEFSEELFNLLDLIIDE